MEGFAIASIIIVGSVLYPFLLVYLIRRHYRKHYNLNKHKISDAEIFKLMNKANHFLSEEQLASVSPLNLAESKKHLMHLHMEGALKRFQDGGVRSIYQLKESLPEDKVLPISIQGLSDEQVIAAVLKYSDDYQVTIAELCIVFDLDVGEAKNVIKRLKKSGLVSTLWRGFRRIHVINDPLTKANPKVKIPEFKENSPRFNIPQSEKIKIPDADVLNLAIQHKGRLTPTIVCVKLKIPMSEAQKKLDELYEEGVFMMQIDEKNALMEYELRDKNLLE